MEPIGNVATVTGIATVIRDKNSYPLKVRDDIYLNDVVQTSSNSSLGITFNDATTFNLSASSKITIDNYVYEDGGKQNSGIFDIGKGTVAFVAAAVAKTGDMKIATPTATLGIRGTTGVVDVPENATANTANNVNIKLYPDADGRVGHIDVNDRTSGTRLGALTQASSGFAIRPGAAGPGGMRFAAVPITIPPQQIARDRGFVSQVHAAQTTGRQIVTEQRDFRRANPAASQPHSATGAAAAATAIASEHGAEPAAAAAEWPARQPGQNNRPGQQQPGAPNRQGLRRRSAKDKAAPRSRARRARVRVSSKARDSQPRQPRTGQGTQPGGTPPTQPQRSGQSPQAPGSVAPQPGTTPQPQTPRTGLQPGTQPAAQPQQGAAPRQPGLQQRLPAAQRPAAPRRPAPAPKEKKKR